MPATTGTGPPDAQIVYGPPVARRGRRVGTTAALASVLIALCSYIIWGNVDTTRATGQQRAALAVDAMFGEARNAIAMEEVHLRHYEVEPSVAVRERFSAAADTAGAVLSQVVAADAGKAGGHANRLLAAHDRYRGLAERLIVMVADRDPGRMSLDRLQVTPAYYTLQGDIDRVSRDFHAEAERAAALLHQAQQRMLVGASIGFAVGLGLVAVIWRMVLGDQRRLTEQADASRHSALHDPLTGLPNRTLFHSRLDAALDAAKQAGDDQVALMIMDLNGFKGVNDTLGHHAGDELLVEVGHRLRRIGRTGDVVARLGGDEFAIMLSTVPDIAAAREVAERVADALRRDFLLEAGLAAVSGSIGIALGPMHGAGGDLMRRADAAMYRAKGAGGGVAVYDRSLDDVEAADRMTLYGELRALLDAGDPQARLTLHYQPQVRIADGVVTAVEALARWEHPQRGLLHPDSFLPIAESRGLEVPLTYHLLGVAVAQAARWNAEGRPFVVAVNVSPRCLLDAQFVARVCASVDDAGLPPHLLRLELTENSVMTEPERAVAALREVHDRGINVSIDDFGTGFSSLAQLKRLPVDELKIDRTFIMDLAHDSEDAVLVRSAIELAHNLGLSVVAEGVEHATALDLLRGFGCDYAQGFGLSEPVPAADVRAACERAQEATRTGEPHGTLHLPRHSPVGSRS
jgi:diguanylate cyclase (GGDEF)-like protein